MKLNQLSLIKSERGLRSAVSSLWFGAKGALLTAAVNFHGVQDTVMRLHKSGYPDRAQAITESNRYVQLEGRLKETALRAGSLSAFADSIGVMLEIDMTPDIQRGKDEKQLAAVAEASGIPVETIRAKEQNAIKRRFDQQVQAQVLAEAEFYSAGFDDTVEFKTETVLNSLVRQRDYMLEWNNLDLAELTVLRHDIDLVEKLLNDEDERTERSSESSIDDPDQTPSMAALNQAHQAEVAQALGGKEVVEARAPKTHRVSKAKQKAAA